MTTTTLTRIQDERLAAGLSILIAAVALVFANFVGAEGEHGGPGEYAFCLGISTVLAALLFGRVLPGAADPARAGWILAGLALVTGFLAPWSGLPFVLGIGAVYSGARAGTRGPIVLGALFVVLSFVACLIG